MFAASQGINLATHQDSAVLDGVGIHEPRHLATYSAMVDSTKQKCSSDSNGRDSISEAGGGWATTVSHEPLEHVA